MMRYGSLFVLACVMFGATAVPAATFNHANHLEYLEGEPCTTCHRPGAPAIRPAVKTVCVDCHDEEFIGELVLPGLKTHGPTWALTHRDEAKGKAIDCSNCHQQADCLQCHGAGFADEFGSFSNNMVNVHRSDFHVTHPIAARTNPQLCASCHESKFCRDCHNQFAPADLAIASHRRQWRDTEVAGTAHATFTEDQCQTCHPGSVLPSHNWVNGHRREARKNLVTCQTCHPEGDVCLKCHSARTGLGVNPHPKDWDDIKGRLEKASNGRTCRKCH